MNIGSISSVVKLTLLTTLVAVTGCTTVVPEPQVAVETPETGIIEQKPAAPRRPHPNEYPVKNFEEDELYELLVAEVAGFRQDYEIALDTYVNIATLTRDPGVATRAAMLAAYL